MRTLREGLRRIQVSLMTSRGVPSPTQIPHKLVSKNRDRKGVQTLERVLKRTLNRGNLESLSEETFEESSSLQQSAPGVVTRSGRVSKPSRKPDLDYYH